MSDKKISELTEATVINQTDVSVLVSGDTDYRFAFSTLLQFLGSNLNVGANISFGTVLPQNTSGKNGDLFINTTTGSFAQKISGTWSVVYSLPSNNTQTDTTVLYGLGVPGTSTGNNGDTYIHTGTGVFYKKSAGSWSQVFSMQTGPQGPQGTAGTNGTNGTNGFSVLNGPGNPSNLTTGANGDFYINTSNYNFFGPKTDDDWGDGVSLIPPGISPGGTIGQALIKNSDADYDIEWFDFDTLYVKLGGSYSNPSWINSLTWNKITGAPTTISGYGITDYNSLGDARWLQQSGGTVTGDIQSTFSAFSSTSFITKNYVDNIITGVIWVGADAATTTNIPLSGEQTVDGVTTSSSRVFVKNQTDQTQNGIYITSTGTWIRATDADTGTKITRLAIIIEGGSQKGNQWVNTNSSITVGITNITFAQSSGLGTYTNGLGIALAANVFSLDLVYVDARYQPLENQRLSTTNSPTFAKVVADSRGVGAGYNSTANHVLIANSTDNTSTNVYPVLVNRSQTTLTTGYGTGILFADQTVALGKILLVRHNSADNWDSEMRFYVRMRNGGYTTDPEVNQVLALTLNNDASATFGGAIIGAGKISTTLTTEQFRLNYDATHYVSHTVDAIGNYTIANSPAGNIIINAPNSAYGLTIQSTASNTNVYQLLPSIPGRGAGFALRDNTIGANLFYVDKGGTTFSIPGAMGAGGSIEASSYIASYSSFTMPSGAYLDFDKGVSSNYRIYKNGIVLQFNSAGGFSFNGIISSGGFGSISNASSAAWGVLSPSFYTASKTMTDTSTPASTTVSNVTAVSGGFMSATLAATNTSITYTTAATMVINGPPTAGTNVTITNPYSLYVTSGVVALAGTTGTALKLGAATSLSTATPVVIDMGGTISNAAGANPKILLFNDGTKKLGFGFSNAQFDYIADTNNHHAFWSGTTKVFDIDGNGSLTMNSISSASSNITFNNLNNSGASLSYNYSGLNRFQFNTPSGIVPVLSIGSSSTMANGAFFEFFGLGSAAGSNNESLRFILNNAFSVSGTQDAVINTSANGTGTARNIQINPNGTPGFGVTTAGKIGSLSSVSPITFRNVLDDGSGNATFAGLVYSTSATPTISVTGAGTGATINISGSNQKQIIQITTGTSPSNMAITVTMSGGFAYPHSCVPVVSALSSSAQTLGWYVSSLGANTYSMYTGATTASTVYYYTVDNGGY